MQKRQDNWKNLHCRENQRMNLISFMLQNPEDIFLFWCRRRSHSKAIILAREPLNPHRRMLTSNLRPNDCEIAEREKWQLPGWVSYCAVRRSQLGKFCPDWSALLIDTQRVVLFLWSALLCSFVFFTLHAILRSAVWSSGGVVDTSAQTLTRSLWGWPINSIFPGANLQFCICPRVVEHEDQEGGWKSEIES